MLNLISLYLNLSSLNFHVIGNFLLYCASTIIIRGISFFTLPLIMYSISPSHYGTLSLITAFTIIMTTLLGLGLRQLLSLEYFHANQQQRRLIIQDILIIYTLVALPILAFCWHKRTSIIHLFFFDAITTSQLLAIFISIATFFYMELMYQLLQYQQKIKQVVVLQCTLAITIAGCTLISIYYWHYGLTGIVWSQAIGYSIALVIAVRYFLRDQALQFKWTSYQHIHYYLWHSFPFIPGTLANWLLSSGDRWILGYLATMHDVGIYAVADLASQLFYAVILQSWGASYLPHIMQQYQKHADNVAIIEQTNHRIMWITMAGCGITISVGYPIAQIFLFHLLPTAYQQAIRYMWILLIGQIFLFGSYFAATFIQYNKHTYFLAFALFIPALLNIFLNWVMIPYWGIMGCSIATLISYIVYFMLTYWYNRKLMQSY